LWWHYSSSTKQLSALGQLARLKVYIAAARGLDNTTEKHSCLRIKGAAMQGNILGKANCSSCHLREVAGHFDVAARQQCWQACHVLEVPWHLQMMPYKVKGHDAACHNN
jgi:hypothetical protein